MKDMQELIEAAQSDVASMRLQMQESQQYGWHWAEAAVTAHWGR